MKQVQLQSSINVEAGAQNQQIQKLNKQYRILIFTSNVSVEVSRMLEMFELDVNKTPQNSLILIAQIKRIIRFKIIYLGISMSAVCNRYLGYYLLCLFHPKNT